MSKPSKRTINDLQESVSRLSSEMRRQKIEDQRQANMDNELKNGLGNLWLEFKRDLKIGEKKLTSLTHEVQELKEGAEHSDEPVDLQYKRLLAKKQIILQRIKLEDAQKTHALNIQKHKKIVSQSKKIEKTLETLKALEVAQREFSAALNLNANLDNKDNTELAKLNKHITKKLAEFRVISSATNEESDLDGIKIQFERDFGMTQQKLEEASQEEEDFT